MAAIIIYPQVLVTSRVASASKMTIALTLTLDIITIILFITIRIGNQITMTIISTRKCISRSIGELKEVVSLVKALEIIFTRRSGLANRKNRRHANDAVSHPQQHDKVRKQHSLTYSSSQLSIEVSKLHAGANGRLEITCVATIPATIAPLEQYADYKSTSVKGTLNFSLQLLLGVGKNSQRVGC